jgi:anti-sigma regulatory factor (Ser/Thr protein kinase)
MSEAEDFGVVLELSTGANAPAIARRFVKEHASDLAIDLKNDAELLVSEVVTNAVVHGRPAITLRVSTDPPGIGIAVHDFGEMLPPTSPAQVTPSATHGRGLLIVEALASTWGVIPNDPPPGKTVWFRLTPAGGVDPGPPLAS